MKTNTTLPLSQEERFLFGMLTYAETATLFENQNTRNQIIHFLKTESAFEALWYKEQWVSVSAGTPQDVYQYIAPEKVVINNENQSSDAVQILSEDEWKECVENSINTATIAKHHAKILPFTKMPLLKLAYAACFILFIGTAFIYYHNHTKKNLSLSQKDQTPSATVHSRPGSDSSFTDTSLAPYHTAARDEVSLKKRSRVSITTLHTDFSVIYLSTKTGLLAEKKSSIRVLTNNDSTIDISLTKGSVLFTVEKNRYARFCVITPHAEIRVKGTVFKVSVSPIKTTVSVFEGTVTITSADGKLRTMSLNQGSEIQIDSDSVAQGVIKNSLLMNKRNNFLRSYLTYMHNTQIERFDPKPLFDALAAKVRQCIDSLNLLSDPIITAQLMRYRAAVRYENERNFTEAGKLYRQLHSENQCPVLSEIVLGKESLMYLNHAEDSAALQRMKLYTQNHPQGILMPELLALCIRILLEHNQTETACDYMVQYISAYASTPYAEPIAFHLAQTLRITEKDWKKAIEYYEFVFTHFPQSKYTEDALYWAGWCLVQEGLKKSENRFFNQYNKSYPDGNWQGVISGYPR